VVVLDAFQRQRELRKGCGRLLDELGTRA